MSLSDSAVEKPKSKVRGSTARGSLSVVALLRALPEFAQDKARLASLPGVVPGKYDRPNGCLLNPRCPYATDKCRAEEPELNLLEGGRQSKCHYPLDDAGRPGL